MKRAAAGILLFVWTTALAAAVYPFPDVYKKFEFSLFGGLAPVKISAVTSYADLWNHQWLSRVEERTSIEVRSGRSRLSAGAAISYFFGPRFGIQASLCRAGADLETVSDFDFAWSWSAAVGGGNFSRAAGWDGQGRFRTIPISLDLLWRFSGRSLETSFSAGPSVFINSLSAETGFGFGFTKIDASNVQYVDALGVGLDFRDRTWTALGFNLGAGLDVRLGEAWSLVLEGRFYFCPAKTLSWDFVLGTYDGLFFSQTYPLLKAVPFDASDVEFIRKSGTLSDLRLNPSFLQLHLGVKFKFGEGFHEN
ncbi:MAG: hypothetical protein FJY82_08010 [Candidatus Aminicenantes bacterium]|nr:hypothetical protein [Candidatus Aminicenantes bacterium]